MAQLPPQGDNENRGMIAEGKPMHTNTLIAYTLKLGMKTILSLLVVTVYFGPPGSLSAQSPSEPQVRAWFEQAKTLNDAGDYAKAVPIWEKTLREGRRVWGPNSRPEAVTLGNLGISLSHLGELNKAEPILRKSLELYSLHWGKEDRETARALYRLGVLYAHTDKEDKAEPLLTRCLQIREAKLPTDDLETALVLFELGKLFCDGREKAKAESFYKRCLAIRMKKLGENDLETAEAMQKLGTLYTAIGNFEEAQRLLVHNYNVVKMKDGPDHNDTAVANWHLGILYCNTGQNAKAESALTACISTLESLYGKDSIRLAHPLRTLATVYANTERYAESERALLRVLAIEERQRPDSKRIVDVLNALGHTYTASGQFAKAETVLTRSLTRSKGDNGPDTPASVKALYSLGQVANHLGLYKKSIGYYERALGVLDGNLDQGDRVLLAELTEIRSALGWLYHLDHQDSKAEALLRQALDVAEVNLGKLNRVTLLCVGAYARFKADKEEYLDAERLFERLAEGELKIGKGPVEHAKTLESIGILFTLMGRLDKAEESLRECIRIYESSKATSSIDLARSYYNYAFVCAENKRILTARQAFDRSRRLARSYVVRILPFLTINEQQEFLTRSDAKEWHAALTLAYKHPGQTQLANQSLEWVLNAQGVSAQAVAASLHFAKESTDPQFASMLREMKTVRDELARFALTGKSGEDRIARLLERERTLSRRLSIAAEVTEASEWVEVAEVRKAVPPNAVLIDIACFDVKDFHGGRELSLGKRYCAWILLSNGEVHIVDLGAVRPIDEAVDAVRKEFHSADQTIRSKGEILAEKELRKPLDALAKLVLHPLLPLVGEAKTWIISPDSQLWLIPWTALTMPDGAYAVEKHTIRFLVSGRDLLSQKNTKVLTTSPLVLADPDFDLRPDQTSAVLQKMPAERDNNENRGLAKNLKLGNIPRLPGTAFEAEAIAPKLAAAFGLEPKLLTDNKALAGRFKEAKNPRAVVLSTHGFFLEEEKPERRGEDRGGLQLLEDRRPVGVVSENVLLRCGLLFAGCNHYAEAKPGQDNGVLTGLEIVGTDLRGTELVVLSACETGLGDVRNGEGVAGLRQAFQLAGAESVVSTLWQVNDLESAFLMAGFFERLAKGQARDEALRSAQLEIVQKRRARFGAAHPYFWAGYTLTGRAK